jgi:ribonuclease-3
MEAVIGAVYLDKGYETTAKFVEKHILIELPEIIEKKLYKDHKSMLQELAQDESGITPTYEVLEEWGPDHDKHFRIGVYLSDKLVGEGEGPNKQEAQQSAAKNALETQPSFKEKLEND